MLVAVAEARVGAAGVGLEQTARRTVPVVPVSVPVWTLLVT